MIPVIKHRSVSLIGLCLLLTMASAIVLQAQNPFEETIKQLNSDNVKGYLQPFANGMGANLNSGTYTTADIGTGSLTLRFQIVGMVTFLGDAEKTYKAVAPQPFDQTPTNTATVYGGRGTVVTDPSSGLTYQFQNGQVKADFQPLLVPQLTVGDLFGTQATLRYAPIPKMGDFPKVDFFGIGVRHNVSQYLPPIPVSIAAGVFYQTLKVGEIMDVSSFNFGAQVSKSFPVVTLYGGLQYEKSTVKLDYFYTGPGSTPNTKVSFEFDGENTFRATAGLSLDLLPVHINADINVGKVTLASAGIGIGF